MRRAVLLSLLLVLGLPLGVAGAPTDGQADAASDRGDVAILTLNDTSRASVTTTSVDVGTSLAVRHDAGAARLDRYALAERFISTEGAAARQRFLSESLTVVNRRISSLRAEERSLRTAYANREIDAETYLRQLALIHARVDELRATIEAIRARTDQIPQFSMDGRIRLVEAALFGLEGPVRQQTLTALEGTRPPTRIYVEVGASGVVLSTIDDGRFVRETYRADHFDAETVGRTSFSEAVEITERLYAPYAYNQSLTDRNELVGRGGGIYLFTMGFREGLVSAYIDGSTADVFFEVQERHLDLLPDRPTAAGSANGTRLVVHRTYPGGPLQVTVADNETEAPRATTVYVDGRRLETGSEGTLWTFGPGVPFEVTAVGPRGNVTVSVRPLAPTSAAPEG
jgi:hypothetical protein